jgi:hypothetical protein
MKWKCAQYTRKGGKDRRKLGKYEMTQKDTQRGRESREGAQRGTECEEEKGEEERKNFLYKI